MVFFFVWIGILGCIDIWDELDIYYGERELNKFFFYSFVIFFGEILIRYLVENIYNVFLWW